jgi:hypothetical protein
MVGYIRSESASNVRGRDLQEAFSGRMARFRRFAGGANPERRAICPIPAASAVGWGIIRGEPAHEPPTELCNRAIS